MDTIQIVIILATIFAVYQILQQYGVFEFITSQKKVVSDITDSKKDTSRRKREQAKLETYAKVIHMFRGIFMGGLCYEQHKYYIERLDIRSEVLNRHLTPEELRGKYAFRLICSLLFIPLGILFPIVFIVPGVAIFMFLTYQTSYKIQISDEDEIIDNYFLDLYLLMYSKLKQGSRARLQGIVENYIDTLESQGNSMVKETMLKFSKYFLNLLSLYEDHVAVPKLREVYNSPTIINFCNVASQALNGIQNADNLLTFKLQLVDRKTNLMRKNAQKILRKGEISIYAIWVILFIFIAVGVYSKLPTGFF